MNHPEPSLAKDAPKRRRRRRTRRYDNREGKILLAFVVLGGFGAIVLTIGYLAS